MYWLSSVQEKRSHCRGQHRSIPGDALGAAIGYVSHVDVGVRRGVNKEGQLLPVRGPGGVGHPGPIRDLDVPGFPVHRMKAKPVLYRVVRPRSRFAAKSMNSPPSSW